VWTNLSVVDQKDVIDHGGVMRNVAAVSSIGVVLCCFFLPASADDPDLVLPENWYRVAPWAEQPPVDLVRRVAAIQSALGGLQGAVNSYSSAIQAQADAHNQRVLMQAELARIEAMQPKPEPRRSNFATRGTPEQIDAANRALGPQATGSIPNPVASYPGASMTEAQAYELGVITADMVRATTGWGNASQNLMMQGVPR